MSSNNVERERLGTLQREYRRAWKTLTFEAEGLQRAARADANGADFRAARTRMEAAAAGYRAARNDLAQALLGDTQNCHVIATKIIKTEQEPVLLAACCAGN